MFVIEKGFSFMVERDVRKYRGYKCIGENLRLGREAGINSEKRLTGRKGKSHPCRQSDKQRERNRH